MARCFRICGRSERATGPRNSINAALGLASKACRLHSYRYAWAERAKTAGYPERFAQVNLGQNSKAIPRAYSRKAEVELPSLSEYERQQKAITEGHATEPHSVAA